MTTSTTPMPHNEQSLHTPLPWRTGGPTGPTMQSYSQPYCVAGTGENIGQLIAGCFGDTKGGEEAAKANAEFIVKACNNYELVVTALKGCQAMLMECAKQHRTRGDIGHAVLCDLHIEQARAALSGSKEG